MKKFHGQDSERLLKIEATMKTKLKMIGLMIAVISIAGSASLQLEAQTKKRVPKGLRSTHSPPIKQCVCG